jgi:hypothetical protein
MERAFVLEARTIAVNQHVSAAFIAAHSGGIALFEWTG